MASKDHCDFCGKIIFGKPLSNEWGDAICFPCAERELESIFDNIESYQNLANHYSTEIKTYKERIV
jgi:hypothetical protein